MRGMDGFVLLCGLVVVRFLGLVLGLGVWVVGKFSCLVFGWVWVGFVGCFIVVFVGCGFVLCCGVLGVVLLVGFVLRWISCLWFLLLLRGWVCWFGFGLGVWVVRCFVYVFRIVFDWFELYCGGLVVVVVWLFGVGWGWVGWGLCCVCWFGFVCWLLVLVIVWVLVVDVCYLCLVCCGLCSVWLLWVVWWCLLYVGVIAFLCF